MIYTSSIIDGFKVLIGLHSLHFALLLTLAICITVPINEDGVKDPTAMKVYGGLCVLHVVAIAVAMIHDFSRSAKLSSVLIILVLMG